MIEVQHLSKRYGPFTAVDDVSFSVGAGEILGLAGLQGSGAAELLLGLFGGYGPACRGEVRIMGKAILPGDPRQAIAHGLALLTGDRKGQHSIRINDQWRICFRWEDGAAHDVEIVDYHA